MPTSRRTPSRHSRANPTTGRPAGLRRRAGASSLAAIHQAIVDCNACPRLRNYCQEIARRRRAAYRDFEYWGRPVPGFGDPRARLLVIGLAPGAHGANRTGRVFTGDGVGGSGDFLMRAMHAHGFATLPWSRGIDDGLGLRDAYIAAAVRCAPPANKPTRDEFIRCQPHLETEWDALTRVEVVLCLGRLAFEACWRVLAARGIRMPSPRPAFAHGAVTRPTHGPVVVSAYHPSRQNTHTGRLTDRMMSDVFEECRRLLAPHPAPLTAATPPSTAAEHKRSPPR
jgi:uracil-DNA glycosylase